MNVNGSAGVPTRGQLLRWAGWFAAANGGLFCLVGLRYLLRYEFVADPLGVIYGPLAYLSHFALLAALPVGLLVVPFALLLPRRAWVQGLGVVLAALTLTLLVVDGNVFAEQRYHLTPLILWLFEPATWVFIGVIGLFALVFQALLAGAVWRWVLARPARGGGWLALVLAGAWLGSQGIHMWADAVGHVPVTQLTRYLPAYFPIHAKRRLTRLGLVDPAVVERQMQLQQVRGVGAGQLRYPLAPLNCAAPDPRPNLLIIMVDGLRPDAIHPELTPRLAAFRAEAAEFASHWSGGNSSKAGFFSFFYGLPSTYFETFYGVQRPPVLMDEIRRRGYELALFASPGFGSPTDMERTSMAGIPNLPGRRPGLGGVERDQLVTRDWLAWLGARQASDQPFFGFLYFDPPRGQMSVDPAETLPMDERFTANPAARDEWRQYRRALRLNDAHLGTVLDSLDGAGLRDDTIVIVASDHGYEFDDNGLGYIGHASNYSAAQLRATLFIRWPGRPPARYTHRTSHLDLPVTLLQDLFGCTADPADYSMGRNLFAGVSWDWIIAGSYVSHAIVEPDRVTVTSAGGFVEVLGPDYRPLPRTELDGRVLAEAVRIMRRFYR